MRELGVDTEEPHIEWWYKKLLGNDQNMRVEFELDMESETYKPTPRANLFCLPREVRGFLCQDYTVDIDISNAHPTVLRWLFVENKMRVPQLMDMWLSDRKGLSLKMGYADSDRGAANCKQRLLAFINNSVTPINPLLRECHTAIYEPYLGLLDRCIIKYPEVMSNIGDVKEKNHRGKQFSRFLRHFTRMMLEYALEVAHEMRISVSQLCHDGLQLNLTPKAPPKEICEVMSQRVADNMPGLKPKFMVKEHDLSLITKPRQPLGEVKKRGDILEKEETEYTLEKERVGTLLTYLKGGDSNTLPSIEKGYNNMLVTRGSLIKWLSKVYREPKEKVFYKVIGHGRGRYVSEPTLNLGTAPPAIKAYLIGDDYLDIDMRCAWATITRYLMRIHEVEVPEILDEWARDRDETMKNKRIRNKRAFEMVMLDEYAPEPTDKFYGVYEAIYGSHLLVKMGMSAAHPQPEKYFETEVKELERRILIEAKRGVENVSALCHDGFLVKKTANINPEDVARESTERVNIKYPGLDAEFRVKPIQRDLGFEMRLNN